MASGSSDRVNSGSKGFDFGSDDILCSYEDYGNHNSSNGPHSDHVIGAANSSKEFHKTRMARSSIFPSSSYSPPEDSFSQDITSLVERTMKKYADNMMRFLEGISSRLSQLELYCYNLDKTIGEMRSDLTRDHGDTDAKLKSLEKHLQEVHRSVQILRDKQELADYQKELAKLQLAHKDSTSSTHSQSNEERASTPASDPKRSDNPSDIHNQQLALALPHQVALPPQPQPQPAPPQPMPQQQSPYYMPPPTQPPNPPAPTPAPASAAALTPPVPGQSHYLPSQPAQSQVNPAPPSQPFSQYQQVWPQQLPQPVQPQQQPSMQPQVRPPPSNGPYPPYSLTQQPINQPPPTDTLSSSMPMQVPYSGVSQQPVQPYGYGAPPSRTPQQPPPQQIKSSSYNSQSADGYPGSGSHPPPLPPPSGYTIYDGGEAGRTHYPPQQPRFTQTGYAPQQPQGGSNSLARNPGGPPPPFIRNNPYCDLIDKLVSMGFRGDHVVGVIQRMEETGQLVDFNSVLDRLNVQSSVGPQRVW